MKNNGNGYSFSRPVPRRTRLELLHHPGQNQGRRPGNVPVRSREKPSAGTDYTDGNPDIEKDFYIIRHTSCPAVLTENLFMDNREDVAFLESEEGAKAIVGLHVEGILQYLSI